MEDLERPVLGDVGRDLSEPRHEARVADELCGDAMVWVPPLERWRDHLRRFRVERGQMARALALSCVMFAMDLGRLLLAARAFGVHLAPDQALVLSVVGVVGGLIPTPGGLGAIEGGLTAALVLFGAPVETALAITLFERGLSYWLGSAAGGVATLLVGGRGLFRAVRGGAGG